MTALLHRRARRRPSLLLVLVTACAAALVGGSRSAIASCGDWLEGHAAAHGGMSTTAARTASLFGDPADRLSSASPTARVPLDRPCDGPACRRAPILPSAPVDAADPLPDLERALPLFADDDDDDDADSSPHHPVDDPHRSSALPGRLERPPRHG